MLTWPDFALAAPRIATIFRRRHAATGNPCMLGTLRGDGFPRVSPMEPRFFEDELLLVGMPGTAKFADLERDSRFTLHTATVDTRVSDGDAKIWGRVEHLPDPALHARWADDLYAEIGLDLRDHEFGTFFAARLVGAAAVEVGADYMDVTTWRLDHDEQMIRKR